VAARRELIALYRRHVRRSMDEHDTFFKILSIKRI